MKEPPAIQHDKERKSRENICPARFLSSRGVPPQKLAQNQAQVERSYMDQLPLQNVLSPSQMAAPHATRLVAVRKAAFDQLTAPSQ